MKSKKVQKNPVGPPTKYRKEYCEMVIEHMAQGFPFESFAGIVGVTKKTLYNWQDEHPEFEEAHQIGLAKNLLYLSKQGKEGLWNTQGEGARNLNFNTWRFMMKNMHQWRDTVPEEQKTEINVSNVPIEELEKEVLAGADLIKKRKSNG